MKYLISDETILQTLHLIYRKRLNIMEIETMKLYIEELKRLKKNKLLWIVILVYTLYNLISIFRYQYSALEVSDGLDPTRQILFLCPQIFILYLVTGYEFLSEQYRAGINESIAATAGGCTGRNVLAGFMVMASVLFVNYAVFAGFDIAVTNAIFDAKNIIGANRVADLYIARSLFINIFLIGLIGISAALVISKIQKRIAAYAVIMAVIFASSYMMSEIATMVMIITDYAVNLFDILDMFNVMVPGLRFIPNYAIGFPEMTYRICLILFWSALLITVYLIAGSRRKCTLRNAICVIVCICCFIGYALPSSRVDMGLSSTGSAMADQHYYNIAGHRLENEDGGFDVDSYTMELDTRRLLKAKVTMKVSEPLEEYKFTLSHSYDIRNVYDESGKSMKFDRDKDALTVYSNDGNTKQITVEYRGANEAYYSCSQGVNLRGSFPYYPVAGFRSITEDGMFMNALFLEKDADFDVYIKSFKKVYSNLEEIEKGHFTGRSNGATFVSGLYTSTEKHGVRIVYPPLSALRDESLDAAAKAAVKEGYGESQIFITPNMNRQDDAVSKEQIITRNCFESVKENLFVNE